MPTTPDAVCPSRPAHKAIEVIRSDPAARRTHWRCRTQGCGAEWSSPWRTDTYEDQQLERIVKQFTASLDRARRALVDALTALASAAWVDAADVAEGPDTVTLTYESKLRKVEQCRRGVEDAREDVRVWALQLTAQMARRDTESSASRQHYIDTGSYLDAGEAIEV